MACWVVASECVREQREVHVGYDMVACDGLHHGLETASNPLPGFILVTKDLAKEDVADIGLHLMYNYYIASITITLYMQYIPRSYLLIEERN